MNEEIKFEHKSVITFRRVIFMSYNISRFSNCDFLEVGKFKTLLHI